MKAALSNGDLRVVAPQSEGPDEVSEDALARAFEDQYRDRLLFDHDASTWLEWDGARWSPDRKARTFNKARVTVRDLTNQASDAVRGRSRKAAFVNGVERFARSSPVFARTSDEFDRDDFLLATPSGTVDLRTGVLRPGRPADMITRCTSIAPAERAECPTFLQALRQWTRSDDEIVRFLQMWAGYCLTGSTREHMLVFIYGPGGNGKSALLNVWREIAGAYGAVAAMDTFEATREAKHTTDLASLRGARLVTASESEAGRLWAEARIKSITGGEPIKARFMRRDFFEYTPNFKLTIVGNHAPQFRNIDDALKRRLIILNFGWKPDTPDPGLPERLRREYSGILRWMIEGALAWQRDGLIVPPSVRGETKRYFDDQDTFGGWLEDECEVAPGNDAKWESSKALFASWSAYARNTGEDPGNAKTFAERMRSHGLRPERKAKRRAWTGVSLRVEVTGDAW